MVLLLWGCSAEPTVSNEPQKFCKVDVDCGAGRYCTAASICRRDCTIDAHCFGPTTTAQCNAQGKCIDTVDAAMPPPEDATPDSKPDAVAEGG
jgi:hypothetical protein